MFKKQFEEILYSDRLLELENNDGLKIYPEGKRREKEDYRLHIINQKELYDYGKDKHNVYEGNKWYGKYLRAPDIYWRILKKTKNKLSYLTEQGNITITRGIKSGADKFFIINDAIVKQYNIEKEFFKNYKILQSTRDADNIDINVNDIQNYFLNINKSKSDLQHSNIIKYINEGERKGYSKNKSVSSRRWWYSLNLPSPPDLLFPLRIREKYIIFKANRIFGDHSIAEIRIDGNHNDINEFTLILNSTICILFLEILGRCYGGGGGPLEVSLTELYQLQIPILKNIHLNVVAKQIMQRTIKTIFEELGFDHNKPIREQEPNPLADRKALDDIVFDVLGLTEQERKEVYWAVAELVKNRLEKAKSV